MTSECQKLGVRHLNRINTEEKVWDGIWNIVPTHWEMLWVVGARLKIVRRKSKNIMKDSDPVSDSSHSAAVGNTSANADLVFRRPTVSHHVFLQRLQVMKLTKG